MKRSWIAVLLESLRVARSARVVSTLVAVIGLAVPLAVLGLTGRNVESQAAILDRIDEVGSRILTVVAAPESSLPTTAVDRIARLEGVAWVVGLGPVSDVRSALGGGPAPIRHVRPVRAPLAFGAASQPGTYVSPTSATRLGLGGAYGSLEPGSKTIVGWFRAEGPLQALDAFALRLEPEADRAPLERIIVATDDIGWTDLVADQLPAMIGGAAALDSTVQRNDALVAAQEAVGDEVARRDRLLVVAVLAASTLAGAVVVFAGTLSGRRDFGRRRAIGATRAQLVFLVVAGTFWPAAAGALIGMIAGWAYLGAQLQRAVDPQYPAAVAILAALALTASAALPAAHAATRDPLAVLRVP